MAKLGEESGKHAANMSVAWHSSSAWQASLDFPNQLETSDMSDLLANMNPQESSTSTLPEPTEANTFVHHGSVPEPGYDDALRHGLHMLSGVGRMTQRLCQDRRWASDCYALGHVGICCCASFCVILIWICSPHVFAFPDFRRMPDCFEVLGIRTQADKGP